MTNKRRGIDITTLADADNVIDFPIRSSTTSPFNKLTVEIILDLHRHGVLQEAVLLYLLVGVGLHP
jgi:hypothetical protein